MSLIAKAAALAARCLRRVPAPTSPRHPSAPAATLPQHPSAPLSSAGSFCSTPTRCVLLITHGISRTQLTTTPTPHPSTSTSTSTSPHLIPRPLGFPGSAVFTPGQANAWILLLRLRLITRGYAEDQRPALQHDPGLREASAWDDRLRTACTRFQLAQGWRGAAADGFPTAQTWRLLWST
ncbi:hypothetical protein [Streptomyces sp. MNP-20]|uniref:hypothetical protein n=1 Tax=Streptomyces sp. MNP-20 TaxID=2721165 RepID=UPI0015568FCB|nr:hypothetical protein [Streptomyces sp. MNP-20]